MSIKDPSSVKAKKEMPVKKRTPRNILLRWVPATIFGALSFLLLLLALSGLYMWHTEAGTRYAFMGAKILSGHRLQGVLESGTLQKGIFLRDVRWHDAEVDIAIDQLQSQWHWERMDSRWIWRLVVPFIRIGQIEVKQTPLPKSKKSISSQTLPQKLTTPVLLQIKEASIERLRISQGTQSSEWSQIHVQFDTIEKGKEQQHYLRINKLQTPYGAVQAQGKLAANHPFALSGTASLIANNAQTHAKFFQKNGKPSLSVNPSLKEERFDVRLSGSLDEMGVDISASGHRLNGRGRIDLWPLKKMPLKGANITVNHFNPRAFRLDAPYADLHLEAKFWPAPVPQAPIPSSSAGRLKQAFKQSLQASGKNVQVSEEVQQLTVEGDVILRNAAPGSLLEHKLPLRNAQSHLRLNAHEQVFSDIQVRMLQGLVAATPSVLVNGKKGASTVSKRREQPFVKSDIHADTDADLLLEGKGRFLQGKGALNLKVQSLNLHRWLELLAPSHLNGLLTWTLNPAPNQQEVEIVLESPSAANAKQNEASDKDALVDSKPCDMQSIELPHLASADLQERKKAALTEACRQQELSRTITRFQTTLKPQQNKKSQTVPLELRIKAQIKPEQINWVGQLTAGRGRAQVLGVLEKNAPAHQPAYEIRSTLDEFNPFVWLNPVVSKRFVKQANAAPEPQHALTSVLSGYVNVQSHWKASSHASLFLHSLKGQRMQVEQCAASADPAACKKALSNALSTGEHSSAAIRSLLEHVVRPSKEAEPSLHIEFALRDSVYQGKPLQGQGQIHTAGARLLPSSVKLALAGNTLEAQGELGSKTNQLTFHLNAPDLSHIGWGLEGMLKAEGELYGSLAHPRLALHYQALGVSLGENHLQSAKGEALLEEGMKGALSWKSDLQGLKLPQIALDAFHIDLAGTQNHHTLALQAKGRIQKKPIDFKLASQGQLRLSGKESAPAAQKMRAIQEIHWSGMLTQLANHGLPEVQLSAPVPLQFTISELITPQIEQKTESPSEYALTLLELGRVQAQIERAKLDLHALYYSATEKSYSSGTVKGIDIRHLAQKIQSTLGMANMLGFIAIDTSALPPSVCQALLKGFSSKTCEEKDASIQKKSDHGTVTKNEVPEIIAPGTNLILDSSWDLEQRQAYLNGHVEMHRRTGDLVIQNAVGVRVPLGLQALSARFDAVPKTGLKAQAQIKSGQFGGAIAYIASPSRVHFPVLLQGQASPSGQIIFENWKKTTPISGEMHVTLPEMGPIGNALGANIRLGGSARLRLKVGGTVAKPLLSGRLDADRLSSTFIQEGITFKDGIVRIGLSNNVIDFEQVSLHGVKGEATLTGKAKIDPANPAQPVLDARVTAKELAIFATLDRQLFISGQANMHYAGLEFEGVGSSPLVIDGAFKVDRALFDLPSSSPPRLGDDVIEIDRAIWKERKRVKKKAREIAKQQQAEKLARGSRASSSNLSQSNAFSTASKDSPFNSLPLAKIRIDLGERCRFHGGGADMALGGALEVNSAPGKAPRAKGDLNVLEGSTFEAFGRKLNIEKGYFAFHGPLDNPGINILAMRRNQEIEAGVSVTGTLRSPDIRLVSEPNAPDSEKLSWLLFGHGTKGGTNLSQENTTMAALALLGNASGKRIAKTIGLDEFNIGQSESGIPDPQVISLAKVLNERLILGYEQSLTTTASLVKLTWQLSRRWSLTAHTGTLNGVDIIHHKRFDSLWK